MMPLRPRRSAWGCQCSSGRRVGRSRSGGFTLVEMLVVVSIILVVAVMALPAVTSLSKAAARRSAVSQAMGILDQARAIALSQGVTVYVAFANGDTAIPEAYRFRSYAVFREVYYPEHRGYVPPGTDADGKAKTKAEPYLLEIVRPWTLLPEGVAFKPVAAEKTVFDGPREEFPFRFAESGKSMAEQLVNVPYLRFNAMGLLEEQNKPTKNQRPEGSARLRLFEGFVDTTGAAVMTNAGRAEAEESVILSPVTGRARREEARSAG